MIRSFFIRLRDEIRAAAIVEFALVAPTLILLIIGVAELGHGYYVKTILDGSVEAAGRKSTLETAEKNSLTAFVSDRVHDVIPGADVKLKWRNYESYSEIGEMENFSDINGDGYCNEGEPFEDTNENSVRDRKGKGGIGNGREAVVMAAIVTYDRLFPMPSLSGWSEKNVITSATVLRNQPYDSSADQTEVRSCPETSGPTGVSSGGAPMRLGINVGTGGIINGAVGGRQCTSSGCADIMNPNGGGVSTTSSGGASSTSGGASSTSGGASSTSGGASSTSGGASSTSGGASSTSGGSSSGGGGAGEEEEEDTEKCYDIFGVATACLGGGDGFSFGWN